MCSIAFLIHHPEAKYFFPIFADATKEVQTKIQQCLPQDAKHVRHSIYTENKASFEAIEHSIDRGEDIRLSNLRWMVNGFGFRGHEAFGSALYVDKTFVFRVKQLFDAATAYQAGKSNSITAEYAKRYTEALEISEAGAHEKFTLTRMMTMINDVSPRTARELQIALNESPAKQAIIDDNQLAFAKDDITVTYLPALLGNVYAYRNRLSDVVGAFAWANRLINDYDSYTYLSFRTMNKTAVTALIEAEFSDKIIAIKDNGEVTVDIELAQQLDSPASKHDRLAKNVNSSLLLTARSLAVALVITLSKMIASFTATKLHYILHIAVS